MNHTTNQATQILAYLQKGKTLTAIEALNKFQCFRLAARVSDLKKAKHKIVSTMVRTKDGKNIAQYRLVIPTAKKKAA